MAKRQPPRSWTGPSSLSEEGKAFTATHPALYLHVWCNYSGINVVANVDHLDAKGRLRRVEIAHATFRTPPPREEDIVLWGARALASWLEARIMDLGEAELNGAL